MSLSRFKQIHQLLATVESTQDIAVASRTTLLATEDFELCHVPDWNREGSAHLVIGLFELYEDGDLVACSDRGEVLDHLVCERDSLAMTMAMNNGR